MLTKILHLFCIMSLRVSKYYLPSLSHCDRLMYFIISQFSDWLESILKENCTHPEACHVVNPGNPSSTFIPESLLYGLHLIFININGWNEVVDCENSIDNLFDISFIETLTGCHIEDI